MRGLLTALCTLPQPDKVTQADEAEQIIVSLGQSSMDLEYEVAGLPAAVRVITWSRLQEAAGQSHLYQQLLRHLAAGLPEDRHDWPEELLPYFPYRDHLYASEGVVLVGDKTTHTHQSATGGTWSSSRCPSGCHDHAVQS